MNDTMLFLPRSGIIELLKLAFDEGWSGYQDLRDEKVEKLLDDYLVSRKEEFEKIIPKPESNLSDVVQDVIAELGVGSNSDINTNQEHAVDEVPDHPRDGGDQTDVEDMNWIVRTVRTVQPTENIQVLLSTAEPIMVEDSRERQLENEYSDNDNFYGSVPMWQGCGSQTSQGEMPIESDGNHSENIITPNRQIS